MTNANRIARNIAWSRNFHDPKKTRREKEWRQKFNQRLLERGVPLDYVLGIDPPIELDSNPADCADEEIWCLGQDAEVCK